MVTTDDFDALLEMVSAANALPEGEEKTRALHDLPNHFQAAAQALGHYTLPDIIQFVPEPKKNFN